MVSCLQGITAWGMILAADYGNQNDPLKVGIICLTLGFTWGVFVSRR